MFQKKAKTAKVWVLTEEKRKPNQAQSVRQTSNTLKKIHYVHKTAESQERLRQGYTYICKKVESVMSTKSLSKKNKTKKTKKKLSQDKTGSYIRPWTRVYHCQSWWQASDAGMIQSVRINNTHMASSLHSPSTAASFLSSPPQTKLLTYATTVGACSLLVHILHFNISILKTKQKK